MRLILLPVLLLLFAVPAHATTLPALRTAYDATLSIDFGTTHINSTVNAAMTKERRTFDTQMGTETVILRHDQGKAYLIIPAMNMAMSMDNGQIPGGYDMNMLQTLPVTAEGTETVNGLTATRYKISGQSEQGSFAGYVWCTADGIPLKVDGNALHEGKTTPVKITTSNLHIRPQDPALFEIPNTVKIIPFSMAQMLMKGSKGLSLPAPQAGQ